MSFKGKKETWGKFGEDERNYFVLRGLADTSKLVFPEEIGSWESRV